MKKRTRNKFKLALSEITGYEKKKSFVFTEKPTKILFSAKSVLTPDFHFFLHCLTLEVATSLIVMDKVKSITSMFFFYLSISEKLQESNR